VGKDSIQPPYRRRQSRYESSRECQRQHARPSHRYDDEAVVVERIVR
jgi:hypothetical protein